MESRTIMASDLAGNWWVLALRSEVVIDVAGLEGRSDDTDRYVRKELV